MAAWAHRPCCSSIRLSGLPFMHLTQYIVWYSWHQKCVLSSVDLHRNIRINMNTFASDDVKNLFIAKTWVRKTFQSLAVHWCTILMLWIRVLKVFLLQKNEHLWQQNYNLKKEKCHRRSINLRSKGKKCCQNSRQLDLVEFFIAGTNF